MALPLVALLAVFPAVAPSGEREERANPEATTMPHQRVRPRAARHLWRNFGLALSPTCIAPRGFLPTLAFAGAPLQSGTAPNQHKGRRSPPVCSSPTCFRPGPSLARIFPVSPCFGCAGAYPAPPCLWSGRGHPGTTTSGIRYTTWCH